MDSIILMAIFGILGLVYFIIYIATLVNQAKKGNWIWFVITLLVPIVLIIYWVAYGINPKLRRKKRW
jgi:hypothetical protein